MAATATPVRLMGAFASASATTTVNVGDAKQDRQALAHSVPADVSVAASATGLPVAQPQVDQGAFIIKIVPNQDNSGRFVITESSLHSMPIVADPAEMAKNIPLLRDFSAGTIDLGGNGTGNGAPLLGGTPSKTPWMVEGYPVLPFITKTYNRRSMISAMTDYEVFARSWQIKLVDPRTFGMLGPNRWHCLPTPCPVFVNVPKFGVGVVKYWRWGNTQQLPILYYAIWKLTPLGIFDGDSYIGQWYEIFATWVKPMKWAISQYWPSYNAVLVMQDDGYEFQWTVSGMKSSSNFKIVRARNALTRTYPQLDATLSVRRMQGIPDELQQEEAVNAAREAIRQQQSRWAASQQRAYRHMPAGGGRMPPWAEQLPDAVNYHLAQAGLTPVGAVPMAPPAPSLAQQAAAAKAKKDDEDEEDDDEKEEDEKKKKTAAAVASVYPPPPVSVKSARGTINLATCNVMRINATQPSGQQT